MQNTAVAGSRVSGPYGVISGWCQPSAGLHRTVNMWSVKKEPKPGFARISASLSSATGEVVRVVLISMGRTLVHLRSGPVGRGLFGNAESSYADSASF